MQYTSLVNHDNWWSCIIHHRSCLVYITCISALTMENPCRQPGQVIPPIKRWCTTVSTGLSKSMNQLWTTYLLTKNLWLVSFVQLLMHPNHIHVKDMDWMLKSMSIHQRNSKGIVKCNFITSYLTFKG